MFHNKNAGMSPSSNVKPSRPKSARMFHVKNANRCLAWFLSNNVERFLAKNVRPRRGSNVKTSLANNVVPYPSRIARLSQSKNARMFQNSLARL